MNEKCRALPSLRHEIRDLRAVPDKAAAAPIGHIDNDGAAVTSTAGNTDGPPLLRRARVRGVDLARGVAMLGMFAVHVGPDPDQPTGRVLSIFHGRSAVLFLFLAGVSLALISGGSTRSVGPALRRSRIKIATRAGVLLILGLSLTSLDTGVDVILPVYAVLFVLALPLLQLRPRTLALLASALAIAGPVLSYLIRGALHLTPASTPSTPGLSALLSWNAFTDGTTSLVINGAYPVMTVLPFIIAGMSVGHLDLSARSVRRRLLGIGATLSAVGYGGSALALRIGDLPAHIGSGSVALGQQQIHDVATAEAGTVPTNSWAWLLTASPHSGTPMEMIGATGCALVVLGAALTIGNQAHRVLHPITAVGMMSLTAYTAHVIAIGLIQATGRDYPQSWLTLATFTATALALAVTWLHFFRSGPLERTLRSASNTVSKLVGA